MSITVMSLVFYADTFTPSQKLVLLALADHANDEGESAYPAISRLVIKTGLGERTVQSVLKELCQRGVISIARRATQHRPNEYQFDIQALIDLQNPGVQLSHPAISRGANRRAPGVQSTTSRGAVVAPESSLTIIESSVSADAQNKKKAEYKERIANAVKNGANRQFELEAAIQNEFHISPNWDTKSNKSFMQWLKSRPENETVAQFARWWKENDWRGKQGQPPTTYLIQELWLQAFMGSTKDPSQMTDKEYMDYVMSMNKETNNDELRNALPA